MSLEIFSNGAEIYFEDVYMISDIRYSTSFHTPVKLVTGLQEIMEITDISFCDKYPNLIFFHMKIKGVDDYLDCGGKFVEIENAIIIPMNKKVFKENDVKNLDTIKQKLSNMKELGINIKAFRALQWRVGISNPQKISYYSCLDSQESADLHISKNNNLMVNTYRPNQNIETFKDYIDKINYI